MIKDFLKYLMMFAILIAAQLLVFNNIEFSGYVNPYVYVLFILLLPFDVPRLMLLGGSFAIGLAIATIEGSSTTILSFSMIIVLAVPRSIASSWVNKEKIPINSYIK